MMKLKLAKKYQKKTRWNQKGRPKHQTDDGKEDKFTSKASNKDEIKVIWSNQENNPFYDMIKLKNEAVFKESRIQIFKILAMSSIKQM